MIKYNLILFFIFINASFGNLVINEIMPAPNSPEPEWIELYNNSKDDILIDTLLISDPSKTSRIFNFTLLSNSYCVITNDTIKLKASRNIPINALLYQVSLPTFNNTNDYCKIASNSFLIDSLYYDMTWGKNGISFERINPDLPVIDGSNLIACLDQSGATPGKENSKKIELINNKTYFRINEIMFDVSSNNAEYIELFNYSNDTANLNLCKFADATTKGFTINEDVLISPKSYFVIFWDSLIFNKFPYLQDSLNYYFSKDKISLNNDEDIITIKNSSDSLIDSVNYYSKWHNQNLNYTKDISLEKIDENLASLFQTSWNSSTNINGGTPGLKNSYDSEPNLENTLGISPNPFSLSKSGDLIKINYSLPYNSSKLNIKLFDTHGYLISYPINNVFLGKSAILEFSPSELLNKNLTPQAYIIFLEATDTNSGSIYQLKTLFVLTE